MNLLKKAFSKKEDLEKHRHNIKVSEEIGMLTVSEFANNREFRRTVSSKFPDFATKYNFLISKIKH